MPKSQSITTKQTQVSTVQYAHLCCAPRYIFLCGLFLFNAKGRAWYILKNNIAVVGNSGAVATDETLPQKLCETLLDGHVSNSVGNNAPGSRV